MEEGEMRRRQLVCLLASLGLVLGAACKKESPEEPKKEVRLELKRAPEPRPEEQRLAAKKAEEREQEAAREAEVKGSEQDEKQEVKEGRASAEDDKVGVKECDEYIAKFLACMEQQPEANRDHMKAGFESTRQAWKAAATTDETRGELASACKTALAAARLSSATKKCKW
jgi:hypothetical protein